MIKKMDKPDRSRCSLPDFGAATRAVLACLILAPLLLLAAPASAREVSSVEDLKRLTTPLPGTLVYADDGSLLGELRQEKGAYVPLALMPRHLINAVVAVEDSRFWSHSGIDYMAIGRAVVKDILSAGLKEGGSTITQQLVKTVFLSPEKTLSRKMAEASLAKEVEARLSKNEILELYLNLVYFGHGAYGVEMAARTYFAKPVQQLTLAESAVIAGLLKAPGQYSPYLDTPQAKLRQSVVLARMEKEGYIRKAEMERAVRQPLILPGLRALRANNQIMEYVRKYLETAYGADALYRRGLVVNTTLDRAMQAAAVASLQAGLREIEKRKGWRGVPDRGKGLLPEKGLKDNVHAGAVSIREPEPSQGRVLKVSPKEALIRVRGLTGTLTAEDALWALKSVARGGKKRGAGPAAGLTSILKPNDLVSVSIKAIKGKSLRLSLEPEPEVEGALVAAEPYTGFIRALVGGYDSARTDFNRAVSAKRQAGSAFKPLIYAAAMDSGYTPASVLNDEPLSYAGGPDGIWRPENYDHTYYGPLRLREALAYSRNVVAVKLAERLGIERVTDYARLMGIQSEIPKNLTIALGSFEVSPLELVMAYNVFAGTGMKAKPILIRQVSDRKGTVLEKTDPEPEQVISPQTSFLVTSMLEDVVRYGTGWRARSLERPVAGKTGTTNENRDAWFIGFTPGLTAGVWVGYDRGRSLGPQETGSMAALPIWISFMNGAVKGQPEGFAMPADITPLRIDPSIGLLSRHESGITEYFRKGTEPTAFSDAPPVTRKRDAEQLNSD